MRKPAAGNIVLIILGGIQLTLSLVLFGVCGYNISKDYGPLSYSITLGNFGAATLYMIVSILAIVSGGTAQKCPFNSTIVLAIIAILYAVSASMISILAVFNVPFSKLSHQPVHFAHETSPQHIGEVVVNLLSFIILIFVSGIACIGSSDHKQNQGPARIRPSAPYVVPSVSQQHIQGVLPPSYPPSYSTQPPLYQYENTSPINQYATTLPINQYATTSPVNQYATTLPVNQYGMHPYYGGALNGAYTNATEV